MKVFEEMILRAKSTFPNIYIKYKNTSLLMKVLNILFIFNPKFMTDFSTTINHTIYFPNENYIKHFPHSASIVIIHEFVHMWQKKEIGWILYSILYTFPQNLFLLFFPIFFIFGFKFAALFLLFLLPFPAPFRKKYELEAYTYSLYAIYVLYSKTHCHMNIKKFANIYSQDFYNSSYYFMHPFKKDIINYFMNLTEKLEKNRPIFKSDDNLKIEVDRLLK